MRLKSFLEFEEFDYDLNTYIEHGIRYLGDLVATKTGKPSPCANSGEKFENSTFSMTAFCWCDNTMITHEKGCPPNFVCGDFAVNWYKYLGRASSQNKPLTVEQWDDIFMKCVNSLKD